MLSDNKNHIPERMKTLQGRTYEPQDRNSPTSRANLLRSPAYDEPVASITYRVSPARTRDPELERSGVRKRVKLWLKGLFVRAPPKKKYRSVHGRPGTPMNFQFRINEDEPDANGLYPLHRVYARSYHVRSMEEDNADLLMMSSPQVQPLSRHPAFDVLEEFPDHLIPHLSLGPPCTPVDVTSGGKGVLYRGQCCF